MTIADIVKRYNGIQEDIEYIINNSCMFFCLLSISEEVNKKQIIDIIETIRELKNKNIIGTENGIGIFNNGDLILLEYLTGKKWSRFLTGSFVNPVKLNENQFLIEVRKILPCIKKIDDTHAIQVFESLHARRWFKDGKNLDPSRHDNFLDKTEGERAFIVYSYS